jgi:hypothetical protein
MTSKVRALSRRTFWPVAGDVLEDPVRGISWVCERRHEIVYGVEQRRMRYWMLLGYTGAPEPIFKTINDRDDGDRGWLDGVARIKTRNRSYSYSESTGTYREE